jgi:hypothetical protein
MIQMWKILMINLIKDYLARIVILWLERKITKLNSKLKKYHARYFEKTGQWIPDDENNGDW